VILFADEDAQAVDNVQLQCYITTYNAQDRMKWDGMGWDMSKGEDEDEDEDALGKSERTRSTNRSEFRAVESVRWISNRVVRTQP
jgi:hypothetical protein